MAQSAGRVPLPAAMAGSRSLPVAGDGGGRRIGSGIEGGGGIGLAGPEPRREDPRASARRPRLGGSKSMVAPAAGVRVECATTVQPLFTPGRHDQRNEVQDAPRIRQTRTCRTAALRTFRALGLPRNSKRGLSCVPFLSGRAGQPACLSFYQARRLRDVGVVLECLRFRGARHTQRPARRSFNQGIPSWRTKRSGFG